MSANSGAYFEKLKTQRVEKALNGLDVEYLNHNSGDPTPNMARVNGYSIIWHRYAYCAGEPGTVEVMAPGGEVDGHVKISKLRQLVA